MQTLRVRGVNPFRWSEYTIAPEGVRFRERNIQGTHEGLLEFDRVGRQSNYFSYHSVPSLVGVLFFLTLSAVTGFLEWRGGDVDEYAWLFWLSIAAVVFVYYQTTRVSGYSVSSAFGTIAFRGRKSKVENFIAAIEERKLPFISDRVSKRLAVMDPAEVDRYLLALWEGGVLSEGQYVTIRAEAGLRESEDARIGFSSYGSNL
jgi:hypothetical protein